MNPMCEKCGDITSNSAGSDKQVKKRNKNIELEDIEVKLSKSLSEEELYGLVTKK